MTRFVALPSKRRRSLRPRGYSQVLTLLPSADRSIARCSLEVNPNLVTQPEGPMQPSLNDHPVMKLFANFITKADPPAGTHSAISLREGEAHQVGSMDRNNTNPSNADLNKRNPYFPSTRMAAERRHNNRVDLPSRRS